MSQADAAVKLTNPSAAGVEVGRLETSCPCIRARLARQFFPPRSSEDLLIHFEAAEEPDFRGRLNVIIRGFGKDETELFLITVLGDVS